MSICKLTGLLAHGKASPVAITRDGHGNVARYLDRPAVGDANDVDVAFDEDRVSGRGRRVYLPTTAAGNALLDLLGRCDDHSSSGVGIYQGRDGGGVAGVEGKEEEEGGREHHGHCGRWRCHLLGNCVHNTAGREPRGGAGGVRIKRRGVSSCSDRVRAIFDKRN